MSTMDLKQAAELLTMHREEVRRRARVGQLPGAKAGKRWVFIAEDLVAYLRSLYASPRQALRVTLRKEPETCHFASVATRGGLISPRQAAKELESRLAQSTVRP